MNYIIFLDSSHAEVESGTKMPLNKNSNQSAIGVTGAAGFIGRFLASEFQKKPEFHVRSLVRNRSDEDLGSLPDVFYGDLTEPSSALPFLSGLDTVIHLANSNFPRDSKKASTEDLDANLGITVALFENFTQLNPKGHIIFFSSGGAVYDPSLPHSPRKESDPTNPISSYGIQKLAAEHFLEMICTRSGISATILRVSNPYGTLLSPKRAQGIIGVAMACLKDDLPFRLFGAQDATRDYIHLDDVVSATLSALENKPEAGQCRIYNVGSGMGVRTDQLLEMIQQATGKRLNLTIADAKYLEPDWNVLDISKIEKELGWKPRVRLLDGLKLTCQSQPKS
jgi:UDP-glucose 4-epimerase